MQDKPYNDIYAKLVDNDDDIMGIVSYAFYKKHKVEWSKKIRAINGGDDTGKADYEAFYNVASTDTAIEGYRKQAQIAMDKFLESMYQEFNENIENVDKQFSSMLEELKEDYQDTLVAKLAEARGEPWKVSIAKNLVASFLFVLLVGVIYFFTFAIEVNMIGDTKQWIEKHVSGNMQSDTNTSDELQK